jgi:hypothetical protein
MGHVERRLTQLDKRHITRLTFMCNLFCGITTRWSRGKRDDLRSLKGNVSVGCLIQVGTGLVFHKAGTSKEASDSRPPSNSSTRRRRLWRSKPLDRFDCEAAQSCD